MINAQEARKISLEQDSQMEAIGRKIEKAARSGERMVTILVHHSLVDKVGSLLTLQGFVWQRSGQSHINIEW